MRKLLLLAAFVASTLVVAQDAMAQSPCCATAANGSSCVENQPGDVAISGCIEADATTCAGGTLDPNLGGPAGCICVGGTCTSDACTEDSAAACCAAGAGNNCP